MIDARNIYRKVTRKIYDFSPEQMKNIAAIVWLYRGQQKRFIDLVTNYLGSICEEIKEIPPVLTFFENNLEDLQGRFNSLLAVVSKHEEIESEKKQSLKDAFMELSEAKSAYIIDKEKLIKSLRLFNDKYSEALPKENNTQHVMRKAFEPYAEAIRGLIKQVDLLYKLAVRVADLGAELIIDDELAAIYDRRTVAKIKKQLDEERKVALEQMKKSVYFYRQVVWLQARFPKAELADVLGLVKLVDIKKIETADWSLTPGRYVGVAPQVDDEDYDFEQTMHDIHTELADLNKEAINLAAKIQENFEGLGI